MAYPASLPADQCDPYFFDTAHFDNLLTQNSSRLFVPDDQIQVKVVEVGHRDYIFTNLIDLSNYLQSTQFPGTRIVLIPQRYSWDRLTVSENGLRLILDYLKAFPTFIDILCAFGKLTSETSDSLGGCYGWQQGDVSESCYLLKNVEQHGRQDAEEPWSIRQLGIYHKRNSASGANTFVILNPTISFQQRLKAAQAKTGNGPSWEDIHMLALSHATWQWRWYLTYWESQLSQLISKAHVSRVQGRQKSEKMPVVTIEYSDFQDVQLIHDRLNKAKFILSSNVNTLDQFQNGPLSNSKVALLQGELKQQGLRVNNLLETTRSGSSLMQDIISFRGLDALRNSSENSNEMARLAEIDSKNMVKLTTKSQRDAGTLKKITILTMVYLPATFVAQFLSMGYLKVNSAKHPASLNFASEMWIFAVLTFILLAITFGLWLYLDGTDFSRLGRVLRWRSMQRQKSPDEKV